MGYHGLCKEHNTAKFFSRKCLEVAVDGKLIDRVPSPMESSGL